VTASSIRLHPQDSVAIALQDLEAGATLPDHGLTLTTPVKRGHKFALADFAPGDKLLRYGQIIGQALEPIATGAHVHTHNLGMGAHTQDYAMAQANAPLPMLDVTRTFDGYHRADGKVGTRNYLGVLTTVNCSATVAKLVTEAAERDPWFQSLENIDGIVPIVHGTGCAMDLKGEGYQLLFRTLQGYAQHANFGGILLIGLGCEAMQVPALVGAGRLRQDNNFRYMTIQQEGGTRRTIEAAMRELREMATIANKVTRQPAPLKHIVVGLQCGGSDGYSGITANPALGAASDLLVQHGGTTILSETPEIYGAEHLLTRRAATPAIAEAMIARIKWWEGYTARNGGEMDNNPSPGNKRGGLTTILEKSLGAVAKGGTAPMVGFYEYAQPITTPGFTYMDSPGYDPASVTGQIASGANLIAFTTGRGSVSGFKPAPGLKLATNTEMFTHMAEDMDINCGDIITAGVSIADKGREIFEELVAVASGKLTKSEELGFGGAEFVPWQIGAVM
jgi:altronate hydrolase/galactarate dehydratase